MPLLLALNCLPARPGCSDLEAPVQPGNESATRLWVALAQGLIAIEEIGHANPYREALRRAGVEVGCSMARCRDSVAVGIASVAYSKAGLTHNRSRGFNSAEARTRAMKN